MKNLKKILFVVVIGLVSNQVFADKWKGTVPEPIPTNRSSAGCEPPKTTTEIRINNVKTKIHTGGDMWWDLQGKAAYVVPADGTTSALYAGAIWVGGLDANDQLKIAAQKFRQRGLEYWPGPLVTSGSEIATVTQDICREYDKHFAIGKATVKQFRDWYNCSIDPECDAEVMYPAYQIPDVILNWPAHGPEGGYDYNLAPFWDTDGDGYYNPNNGDFPFYEFANEGITDDPDCLRPRNREPKVFGDSTLWWVYNDKGNIHTETGGAAIGLEFRAQAFGFTTNDELNDMTFYNYNIINRSTYTLYKTYFGVWTDADLGYAQDDYTGCDVQRGLGYMYNGDNDDETADGINGYGSQPPAIGIDFFEGPYQDEDGIDNPTSYDTVDGVKTLVCTKGDILNGNINGLNFGDGIIDNERWGMSRFLYFNNSGGGHNANTLDPETAIQHYNYLTGFWLDNTPLSYGGTGHFSGGANTDIPTDFMFPGNPTTDICGWGQGGIPQPDWSEETENNPAGDRRFVQSAGPFTLYPGAANDITLGAVYARAPSGGPWASVEAVRRADDKAQILFENCFRVLDGPDAPELKIVEMDKRLIFHIYNNPGSNNYLEAYAEKDPTIVCFPDIDPCDEYYRFQGYQVFQYATSTASISDRYNPALTRQIFQCDIKDDVDQIVNYEWSDELRANIPVEEVNGLNDGIVHTFVVENDLFADGDARLINNREYYYTVIAYGYNNTMLYNQTIQETFGGQKQPYLAGRNNIKKYTATPHIIDAQNGGTVIQGDYGYGPKITMYEGHGNANNLIDLTQETIDEIMKGSPWKSTTRTYENGRGPIGVKIIDPLNVPEDTYYLKFDNSSQANSVGVLGAQLAELSAGNYSPFSYTVTNSAGDVVQSEVMVAYGSIYEQLFMDWGFSISISQEDFALAEDRNEYQNGFIEASMEFEDETKPWLSFVPDTDGHSAFNWIRSGTYVNGGTTNVPMDDTYDDILGIDDEQFFEKILGGTWAPYRVTSSSPNGPAYSRARNFQNVRTEPVSSVDIIITSDKSKWTRSAVIEMCDNEWETYIDEGVELPREVSPFVNYRSIGQAHKFALRKSPSVDKEGNPDGTGHGMGWFPGYAIDIRTGERLNIVFGEDSWLVGENGSDMIWNPSPNYYTNSDVSMGGKHVIYVMGNNYHNTQAYNGPAYDSCKYFHEKLMAYENGSTVSLTQAWTSAMWCAYPVSNPTFENLVTDLKIRLRVATPYYMAKNENLVEYPENDNYPSFSFNTADVKTITNNVERATEALDLIKVVPNPYYGSSYYENNQLDNYVRITNLPRKCTISIFNSGGVLVRRYNKDSQDTYIQWDLKNTYGISISSGVYIMHVDVPGVGEKVVKWFGALRPVDLNNF